MTVCFIFVPGHAGVRGNERADTLAAMATVVDGQVMDRADILNALREVGRVRDSEDANESATLTWLKELQIKRGVARQEYYTGNQRRLVHQHRTRVLRKYTLEDVLKRGSEHLRTCPMCGDDNLSTT
jgi:hypothetical protein